MTRAIVCLVLSPMHFVTSITLTDKHQRRRHFAQTHLGRLPQELPYEKYDMVLAKKHANQPTRVDRYL